MSKKRAVIYARFSSHNQTEQSIEGQLRECYAYAKRNGLIILNEYIDRALSGTTDNRPQFKQMIEDSKKGDFDFVLVYQLDRFARNRYDSATYKAKLKKNGVRVLSAKENISDDASGVLMESVLEGMAEYYSAELSQKVKRGIKESLIKGNYIGGYILYGFDVVNKKYVINEVESEIVRKIFRDYANGKKAIEIVNELNNKGLKTKYGNKFTLNIIAKMIRNEKYIGICKMDDEIYTNIFPPIIEESVFKRCNLIMDNHKHRQRKDSLNEDVYILSGKLFCGYCKHKMIGESGKEINKVIKYRYYSCLTKRRRKKEKCELEIIKKEQLEKEIMDITWRVLSNDNNLKTIAKSILNYHERVSRAESNLKSLEMQRASYLKASQNLITAIEQGIITEQTKIRLKELEAQISQLDYDIEQEKQRNYTYLTEELIIKYFKGIICGDIENIEIQKGIVKTFIREIIVFNDEIIIVYNFTEPLPSKSIIPDNIAELEQKAIDKLELLTEKDVNINADLSFFCSNQYFAIKSKRNKRV